MKEYKGSDEIGLTTCFHCEALILFEDATYLDGIWLCPICYSTLPNNLPGELPTKKDDEV